MPFAFKSSGIITSFLLMFFLSIIICYTYYLMVKISDMTGKYSYQTIAEHTYGKWFGIISEICVFLFCFGCLVAYVVIIGELTSPLFAYWLGKKSILANVPFITGLILTVVVYPLCLAKEIRFISYASTLSIFAAFIVAGIILMKSIQRNINGFDSNAIIYFGKKPFSILSSTSIYSFALGAHQSVIQIYSELNNRSATKMVTICFVNVISCFLFYSFFGLIGYFLFYDQVQDNILKNLSISDPWNLLVKICVAFIIILTFPLMQYCCRNSIERIFFQKSEFTWFRWSITAFLICIVSYGIGIGVPYISVIFSFSGATTGVFIMYLFPCLVYLKLETDWKRKIIPAIGIIFAILLGILCTISQILELLKIS